MVLADWMSLEISCLGATGATAGAYLVGTCGPGMAASLIWIQCLLKTPFGVWTTYELGVSAFWRTSPGMDHFLVEGSCSLTNCFGRSLGSSLVWASYLLKSCLDWSDAWTASLSGGGLMMAGRVVFSCLFCKSSPGDGVLQTSGVALNCSRARWGSEPSSAHLVNMGLMVWTWCSMNPCPLR